MSRVVKFEESSANRPSEAAAAAAASGTGDGAKDEKGEAGGAGGTGGGLEEEKVVKRGGIVLEPYRPMAYIRPERVLEFNWIPGMPDPMSFIEITNLTDSQLTFKIKCSAPEYYRVYPYWGFVNAGEMATIAVTVLPSGLLTVDYDKFLVAVMYGVDVFDKSDATLSQLWHSMPVDPTKYMEQRLGCIYIGADRDYSANAPYGAKVSRINKLLDNNQRLGAQLGAIVKFQLLLGMVILLCSVVVVTMYYIGGRQYRGFAGIDSNIPPVFTFGLNGTASKQLVAQQ